MSSTVQTRAAYRRGHIRERWKYRRERLIELLPTRHRLVFVPLDQATVGPGYLKVGYDRKLVREAPSIGTDGELPAGDEEAVFAHYGLAYQAGADGERRLARR